MRKVRIGIVTITNGPDNYGNVLQNYAVQQSIKKIGRCRYETINNLTFKEHRRFHIYIVPKFFIDRKRAQKSWAFNCFKQKHIKYSRYHIGRSTKNLKKISKKYDKIICGSDQIWNPDYKSNHNWDVSLLRFAEPEQKIAFVVSFGVSSLEREKEEMFADALKSFHSISVRENSGADLVEKLIGKRPQVLIDPTMILERQEWDTILKPIKKLNKKKFILKYVLGDVNQDVDVYLRGKHPGLDGYEIIDLMNFGGNYSSVGPGEFIWLIKNAVEIVTDSYHATIFSILYHKDFMVFKRKGEKGDTFDRLVTLLDKFGLDDHIYAQNSFRKILKYDFAKIDNILYEERNRAIVFLEKSIME